MLELRKNLIFIKVMDEKGYKCRIEGGVTQIMEK